jgi:GNAT superfamily N-acetyltransferase
MKPMNIELAENPTPEDIKRVHDSLELFSQMHTAPSAYQPLVVFVRNDNDDIIGGLTGGTYWQWCHVDILWLDERLRGQGIGSKLLQMAEDEATRRGCVGIFLDTMSFQAPDFYVKHGYTEWGKLDDFPPGHQRIFFKKWLMPERQS